jgi:iron complex outermembrane recepter protein
MRVGVVAAAVCLSLVGLSSAGDAQAAMRRPTDNPAQSLGTALQRLARDRRFQVVFRTEVVGDLHTAGAVGEFTLDEALTQLLSGTGLSYQYVDEKTITIMSDQQAPQASSSSAAPTAQATDGASESTGVALEEIVVTAQKREQRLQDVPMSISVIRGQDIDRRGLIGMEDYLRSVPGVNQIERGIDNAIVIRGITTSPQAENFNSGTTVATYFGETPITGAAGMGGGGIDVRPVDIERIEVLRGPQGTAYGSSSLGGTMRLLPAAPRLEEFSARALGSYGKTSGFGGDDSMLQGIVNVPLISGQLGLRVVGYRYEQSGFYRNVAGSDPATLAIAGSQGLDSYVRGYQQDDVGAMRTTGGRLATLWQATEALDISLNLLTQRTRSDGAPEATLSGYQQARIPVAPQDRVRGELGEVTDTDLDLASLVMNYDLHWGTVTTSLSRVQGESAFARDVTLLVGPPRFPAGDLARGDFNSSTAEVRVASRSTDRLQFLAGVFLEDIDQDYLETIDWPLAPAPSPVYVTNPISLSDRTRNLEQRAVFGEISYGLTQRLRATVGGRYFSYDKQERVVREGGLNNVPTGTGVTQLLQNEDEGSTFKADLSYTPREDALLYVSWSQGFRLGRTDTGLPPATCDRDNDGIVDGTGTTMESTRNIDSDFLDNYEAGARFSFLDRRMTIDAAVFHIDWDGLPIRTITPGTCGRAYTANVGAATSEGVELQTSLLVAQGLRIDLGAGYTHAELAQDAPGITGSPRAGARLPGSPDWNANVAAEYEFEVAGYKSFARVDSFYTGAFYGDLLRTPGLKAGNYVKTDARVGIVIRNLSIELFAHNLTNEDDYTWRGISGAFSGAVNPFFGYRLRPRTFGMQLGYSFE